MFYRNIKFEAKDEQMVNIKYNHIYLIPLDTGVEQYERAQPFIEYFHLKKRKNFGMKPNEDYQKYLSQNIA